jgi:hypothetical protein
MKTMAQTNQSGTSSGRAAPWSFLSTLSCRRACLIALLCAILVCFPWIRDTARDWKTTRPVSWEGVFADSPGARTSQVCDIDTFLIHQGVIEAPRFRDTFRWWHGVWAGKVLFYRPLTSELFWAEWKLFGLHEKRYLTLAIALHLIAVWQFTVFVYTLAERFKLAAPGLSAALSGAIFAWGMWVLPVRDDTLRQVFGAWKNMPEALTALFWCASLTCTLRLQSAKSSRSTAHILPGLLYLGALCSKEAGLLLPALSLAIELPELFAGKHRASHARMRLTWLIAAAILYLAVRTASIHTLTGFRYGSNGTWPSRMADIVLGLPATAIRTARWVQIIAGATLAAAALVAAPWKAHTGPPLRVRMMRVLVVLVAGLAASMTINKEAPLLMRPIWMLLQIWDLGEPGEYLGLALTLIGTCAIARKSPWVVGSGFIWLSSCAAMLAFTPSSNHRLYLPDGGWAYVVGCGLVQYLALWMPGQQDYQEASQAL